MINESIIQKYLRESSAKQYQEELAKLNIIKLKWYKTDLELRYFLMYGVEITFDLNGYYFLYVDGDFKLETKSSEKIIEEAKKLIEERQNVSNNN